jgi:hypothetical protein
MRGAIILASGLAQRVAACAADELLWIERKGGSFSLAFSQHPSALLGVTVPITVTTVE